MALSLHSWHSVRLSAHEGAPVARRSAGPGPGKGTGALLLATRLEPAMSHEPRAEQNAKNEAIRP